MSVGEQLQTGLVPLSGSDNSSAEGSSRSPPGRGAATCSCVMVEPDVSLQLANPSAAPQRRWSMETVKDRRFLCTWARKAE